jgi:hypothetical protein
LLPRRLRFRARLGLKNPAVQPLDRRISTQSPQAVPVAHKPRQLTLHLARNPMPIARLEPMEHQLFDMEFYTHPAVS